MGILDGPLRAAVDAVLGALQDTATLTRTTQGTYDPVGGGTFGEVVTTETVKIGPPAQYSKAEIDWTAPAGRFAAIQRDDMKIIMAALGASYPDPQTDTLTVNGVLHRIVKVSPIMSGALPAAFELQVRK